MIDRRGFTLVETLVVLSLVSLVVGLWSSRLGPHRALVEETHFWQSYRQLFQRARETATDRHSSHLRLDVKRRLVLLETSHSAQAPVVLRIPRDLSYVRGPLDVKFDSWGRTQATTIWWQRQSDHSVWRQTIQFGGTLFYVKPA